MTVDLTGEELELFHKNGITDADIQATVNRYRDVEKLDDAAIRRKVDVKLEALKGGVVTPELKGQNGETVTPESVDYGTKKAKVRKDSWFHPVDFVKSLGKGFLQAPASFPRIALKKSIDLWENIYKKTDKDFIPYTDYEKNSMMASVLGLPEQGGAYKVGRFIGDIAPYFLLPETNVAKLGMWGNRALTFGYQGGLGGYLDSVANKGFNAKENLKDAGIGAVGAIALGGAVAKGGDKIARLQRAKNVMKRRNTPLAERMTAEQKENVYFNRSIDKRLKEMQENPDVINDENFYKGVETLSPEDETRLLDAVDEVSNNQNINKLKEQRKQNLQAKADEIAKINAERQEALKGASFMNPSAKINQKFNKQVREAQLKYNKIDRDLKGQIKDLSPKQTNLNTLKEDIGDVAFSKSDSTYSYVNRAHKGKFFKQSVDDPETYEIKTQMQNFNEYVKQLKKNPELVNDEAFMSKFEADFNKMKSNLPDYMAGEFDDKLNQLMTKTREYNAYKSNKNNPPEWEEITEAEYNAMNNPVDDVIDDVADDIPPVAEEVTPKTTIEGTGELKNRGLAESVVNAEGTPKEVRQAIRNDMPQYRVLHNNELTEQAVKEVEADFNNELSRLLTNKTFDVLDVEKARQVQKRLLDMGRYDEAVNLLDKVGEDATKKGQAIQALSLWSNMTPDGVWAKAQKVVKEYNKKVPDKKKINLSDEQQAKLRQLGQDIVNAEEGSREKAIAIGQAMKYTGNLIPKGWTKKLDTFRYENMLLSDKSRFKDFILTGVNSLDSAIDEGIANLIVDPIHSVITGKPKVFGGLQPKAWGKGFSKGLNEAVEDIKLGINTSRSGETGRYGLPNTSSFEFKPILNQKWESITNNPISNALNNVLAAGERGLDYTIRVPDRAFYEGRYASSIADQMKATEKLRSSKISKLQEKLNKSTNQEEINKLTQQIEQLKQPTQDMIEQAQQEALKAVYQDKSWVSKLGNKSRQVVNDLTEDVQNSLNLPFELPKIGNFVEPFVTTPANIANIGLENTAGAMPGIVKLLTAKTPQEIRNAEMLIAKNIKGALAAGGLGEAIYQGKLKSNIGLGDYEANDVTGLRPESIVFGDKAISLKDYPQLGIPLNTYLGLREGGLPKAIGNVTRAIGDISALKGIGDLMDSFKPDYPGQEDFGPEDVVNNIIRKEGVNLISQLIPFGGELGEIRNDIDPYKREIKMPKGETNQEMINNTTQYVLNRLQNRIPGASRGLPIKYNAIGQPAMTNNIQNPVARVLSEMFDFGIRNYKDNENYSKLSKFKDSIKNTKIKGKTTVGVNMPSRNITVNGEKIQMNNKQYSRFSKDFGKINYKLKDWAINSDEFKNMSDEEKVDYLNKVKQSAEEAVKIKQYGHQPSKKYKEFTEYILDNWEDLTSDN